MNEHPKTCTECSQSTRVNTAEFDGRMPVNNNSEHTRLIRVKITRLVRIGLFKLTDNLTYEHRYAFAPVQRSNIGTFSLNTSAELERRH